MGARVTVGSLNSIKDHHRFFPLYQNDAALIRPDAVYRTALVADHRSDAIGARFVRPAFPPAR